MIMTHDVPVSHRGGPFVLFVKATSGTCDLQVLTDAGDWETILSVSETQMNPLNIPVERKLRVQLSGDATAEGWV